MPVLPGLSTPESMRVMDRLGDFLEYCLQHGLGGLGLLVIAGTLALIVIGVIANVLIWMLVGLKFIGRKFMVGARRGLKHDETPPPP